jgi:hypothetical protein
MNKLKKKEYEGEERKTTIGKRRIGNKRQRKKGCMNESYSETVNKNRGIRRIEEKGVRKRS